MARPWAKRPQWPRVGKRGRRSYVVGFYDHDRRERSRTFPTERHARAWMDDYITADAAAGGPSRTPSSWIWTRRKPTRSRGAHDRRGARAVIWRVNAHPSNEGGLAPGTYKRYESSHWPPHARSAAHMRRGWARACDQLGAGARFGAGGALQRARGHRRLARTDAARRRAQADACACMAGALSRAQLGGRLAARSRDRDQRMQTHRWSRVPAKSAASTARRRRRPWRRTTASAGKLSRSLEVSTAGRRGDPRRDPAQRQRPMRSSRSATR